MPYRADPGDLTVLSVLLADRSQAATGLSNRIVSTLTAHGHPRSAAGVAGTLRSVEEWARAGAADLKRRIAVLESGEAVDGTDTRIFAPTLNGASPAGSGPISGHVQEFWRMAFTGCPTAAAVADLFSRMSPADAGSVVAGWPEVVGSLDGVPVEHRIAANRILIRHELARVREELRQVTHGYTPVATFERLRREAAALTSLLERDRRFVLFDWEGDGRIAEWHGSLDAGHVLFDIPGMGSDKLSFEDIAERGVRMVRHDPTGGDLAVVTTLVYEAPDGLWDASQDTLAEAAGWEVAQFVAGLDLGDRHLTVMGHSYGSVVLGWAFRRGLGRALDRGDDAVIVGSPGTGFGSVDEMDHPGQVWAIVSADDWIDNASSLQRVLCKLPRFGPDGADDCGLIHGTDPASADFGALVVSVDDGSTHSGYWDVDVRVDGTEIPRQGLSTIIAIATGAYDRIRFSD